MPEAYEPLNVAKEHETQFNDNPNHVITLEIIIDIIPVLT